jgi:hypothetical protein
MKIRVILAGRNAEGIPDFFGPVTVEVTEDEYKNRLHYEMAGDIAGEHDFEILDDGRGSYGTFGYDERDAPFLFEACARRIELDAAGRARLASEAGAA